MKRTNEPSWNCGSHTGEPGLRERVSPAHLLAANGGPLQTAPSNGSPSSSNISNERSGIERAQAQAVQVQLGRRSGGSVRQ